MTTEYEAVTESEWKDLATTEITHLTDEEKDYLPRAWDEWIARVRRDAAREAEAERNEWKALALQERGAALDALRQIKARDARIKAVEDVLDEAEASINHHPAYTFSGQRMDPIVNGADIRRALDN